eukprot:scaffold161006_cov29-Tisochrysis_lutea.AAC.1
MRASDAKQAMETSRRRAALASWAFFVCVAGHADGLVVRTAGWMRAAPVRCVEGLDAESDSVGPGIYGGNVLRDESGRIVIGKQFEEHNALPGPVYAGGGYTPMSAAIRKSPQAVAELIARSPELATEISTGGATPLHVSAMSSQGQYSAQLLINAGADIEAVDSWGYTPIQRAAANNLPVAAEALRRAGADHNRPSGLEGTGDSARALARRLRAFGVLKCFQQWELIHGIPLPDDEIEL